ncbi:hypothetical protein G4B88_024112 [Cannabis sativa]|uniref:RNase H type-1 domain-containing protein n=1 Tax=Cannabis sativa TaxID=3483 RepID=A0A7J6EGT4_CANSA|nr:hypothetical protein G4B88_024112 [Cannabis sativa]
MEKGGQKDRGMCSETTENHPTAPTSSKIDKGKKVISADDNDPSMGTDHGTNQQNNVGGVGSNEAAANSEGKSQKLKKVGGNQSLDGCSYLRNVSTMHGETRGFRPRAHPMNRINNDKRDEGVIMSFMADIGPTRDQMVEIPHEEVCKSRKPHFFPKPTSVEWPINKGLVEVVNEIMDPSKGVNASAQQIITCNDITLASNGPILTGQKKRKAAEWVIPIVQSPNTEKTSVSLPSLEIACYSAGSKGGVDNGSSSKQRQSKRICASKGRKKATGRTKNQLGSLCKEEESGKFLTFVGTLFDTIWFSRNAFIFRGNQVNVLAARHKMLHKMKDFISLQVHGFFVTDASWKEGRVGIAVGCQDRQSGKWFWSAKAMDADSAMEAEALAVFWAMQLGSEYGFRSIAIASDALLLVQSLTAQKLPPCWKSKAVVAKIWSLFGVMSSSSISYKSRRRFVERGEWIPPECKYRMKCVERTLWTEENHDPPLPKSEFDLVRRMEELEEKVKILSKIIQRRDDEVDSLMKFRKVFNVALFVLVLMVAVLLFYYV